MRISDWSSDVCSSEIERILWARGMQRALCGDRAIVATTDRNPKIVRFAQQQKVALLTKGFLDRLQSKIDASDRQTLEQFLDNIRRYPDHRSEEHTSELQSLMRISYAVFCLKKKI